MEKSIEEQINDLERDIKLLRATVDEMKENKKLRERIDSLNTLLNGLGENMDRLKKP